MEFTCHSCTATFELVHEEKENPGFCPFCSVRMSYEEEVEENDDTWGDEDE